ncbi:MAG: autotransporter-associated beta strand repeat-containing protein, partial [Alphaproteobacteria bacterium]|nr:autotransporter-associated beta strand repeat-containing protein [Alphaproteobacteria bacterium]
MVGVATMEQASRPRRVMRAALLLSTALTATAFAAMPAMAQDATWKTNANTSWFNDSSNWSTGTIPTGVASFGQSSISSIISDSNRTVGTIQFNSDARAYNFNFYGGSVFTLTGGGIVNNGSQAQNFQIQNVDLLFQNSASAGNNLITYAFNSNLGKIEFSGTSTAGSANFAATYAGRLVFKDSASGGTASYTADSSTVLDITGLTNGGTTIGSIAGGGTILLGGNTLTVGGNNASTTYSGVISGLSGRLVKEGTGTLTLTGANTYLGGTTVNAGTLRLGASNVLTFNRPVMVNSGGTLDLNNFNTTLGQVTGDGSVTLGSARLTLIALGGTFSGVISGSGGLSVGGGAGATYTLSGTNTYSGGTALNSNIILSVSSDANLGNVNGGLTLDNATLAFGASFNLASTRAITIGAGGGTINVGGNNTTISGAISGAGGLTKRGTGTLTLSGTNDFAGLTIVGDNVVSYVAVSADNQLGTAGAGVTANTLGFLKATSSFSSSRSFTLTGGYAGFSVDTGATLTWDGVVSGNVGPSGGLSVRGPGTLVLTGTNTYVGGTAIGTGTTLQISSDANLGNGSNAVSLYSGTLAVTSDMSTGRSIALESGFNGTISVSSGKTLTYSGIISGDASSRFIKAGDGTLVLTGANSYTGGTTVSGGTLVGTTNTLKGDIVNNGIVQFNQNLTSTYSGNMSGSGALVVTGAVGGQTLVLTGTNTHSGGTTVTGSPSVTVSSDAALGSTTGSITLSNQGTLRFGASFNLASTRAISAGSGGGRLDTNGFDTTISQSITGPGFFSKYGAGTLTFTAANTFSSLGIYGGAVEVSANNQLGAGTSAVSINNGATLRTASSFAVNRFLGVYSGASVLDVTNAAATLNWASQIYGTGALAKAGAGTLVLHAGNIYSGGTIISGGTLAINGDSALGAANGGLTFDGGTLQFLAGFDITSARAITLNAGGGTVHTNGFSSSTSGPIGGSGGLTKIGTGTLTLSGTNTYTGGTFLNAGTLAISVDGNLGDAAGRVTFNGGTLQFAASTTLANTRPMTMNADGVIDTNGFDAGIAGVIGGLGGLVKNGTGTLFLAAGNTYLGGTTINGGAISISASTAMGNAASTITFNGGTLLTPVDISLNQGIVLAGSGTIVNNAITRLNGVVSGSGDLTKSGSGVLALIAANTFTGRLVVNQSVVVLQDGVLLGNIAVASGASVNFQDYTFARSSTYAGVISGAGRISQTGRGTLTLSGTNTYSGGTIVGGMDNSAILAVSSDANLGDSSGYIYFSGGKLKFLSNFDLASTRTVNINNFGGTFALNGATTTFGGVIENAGRLTIEGPGTMTFTGANTYGGGTTVRDGAALAIGSDARLGTGDLALDGGTLRYLASFDLSNTRPVTLNAGGGTFDTNGFDTEIAQAIGGTGGLTKSGTGTLLLSANNSYSGGTTINGGTLRIGGNTALGNSSGGITFNGGTLQYDSSISNMNRAIVLNGSGTIKGEAILQLQGAISGSGDLIKEGMMGVLSLTGPLSYTGRTIINGGLVSFGTPAPQGDVIVNNGEVAFGGTTASTYGGVISGAGSMSHSGAELTLTGTNTYSGGTRLEAGTIAVSREANLGATTGGLTFSGGTLKFLSSFDLSSTRNINLSFVGGTFQLNGATTTVAGRISGTAPLTVTGPGTMTLTFANTYTGGTILSGGATLAVGNDAALGGVNSGVTFNNGTLQFLSSFNLANTRALTLNAGGGTIDTNGNDTTISQVIGGTGGLTKTGAGTLTLTGSNSYTGATTINGGVLAFSEGYALASSSGLTINGGTLRLTNVASITRPVTLSGVATFDVVTGFNGLGLDGNVGGTGSLVKTGAGSLTLRGTADYTGGTTVSGGSLVGSAANLKGNITNNALVYFGQDSDGTYAGVMSGTGTLSKYGSATLTLTGLNTHQGGTHVTAGTLAVGQDANLGSSTADISIRNGATLRFLSSFDLSVGRDVELVTSGRLQLVSSTNRIAGTVHGTGNLSIEGPGTLSLTGTNTFTGTTSVTGSTLAITGDASLGNVANALTLDNSTLRFLSNLTLAGTRAITMGAGSAIDTNGYDATIASAISGNSGLTQSSAGRLSLTGTNTYSGGTVISGGSILAIGSDAALGDVNGGVTFDNGTLQLLNSFDLASTRALTLNAGGGTIDTNGNDTTIGRAISGTGGLTKTGAGTLTLSGANTYAGGTTVSDGTLRLGAGASLLATGALTMAGGTFDLNGQYQIIGPLSGTGGRVLVNGQFLQVDQSTNTTFGGTIEGSGRLVKAGNGTLTLSGSNTHTGGTAIGSGTLAVASDAALGAAGGALAIEGGFLQTTASFSTARTTSLLNGGGFDVDYGTTLTHGGTISGSGYLVKQGAGTLVLEGTNTYTAETVLGQGTLKVTSDAALGAASANLRMQGGTLWTVGDIVLARSVQSLGNYGMFLVESGTTTLQGPLSGDGILTKDGAGTLTLAGTSTYSGRMDVLAGTLQGTTSTLRGTIYNYGRVVFDQDTDGSYQGFMQNSGSVAKRGSGIVVFEGSQSYTGGTAVEGGTLRLASGATLSSFTGLTVNGGTFDLNGNSQTISALAGASGEVALGSGTLAVNQAVNTSYAGTITGSGALIKIGAGTLTLSGANSYSGGTIVNGGLLQGTTTSLQGSIVNNAVVYFNQAVTGTYAGVMSGSGSMLVTGGGRVILTGNSTYAGGTTVGAGNILQLGNGGTTGWITGNVVTNGTLAFNRSDDVVFSGDIGGIGGISLMGPGTVTLTGNNTFTGDITVGGTIRAGSDAQLGPTGNTLRLAGGTVLVTASFASGRPIELVSDNGTFDTNGNDLGLSGVVSGAGRLVKAGSGVLTLSGTNTYSGGTTVSGGTLAGTTTSLQGDILNNAAVVFEQNSDGTYAGAMSGSGSLTKTGSGNLTLSGANTYSGGTSIADGTLTGTTSSLQGNIANSSALFFDQATAGTYAGILSGSGNLVIANGDVTLAGANSYSGTTTVQTGATLRLGTGGSLGSTRLLDVNAAGTFDLGGGTQTVGGLTGAGTIQLGTGGALTVDQATSQTFGGVISGDGSLTKAGSGTLVLSGANSYTGGTTVSGGSLTGTASSLQGNIVNNASVVFDQSSYGEYTGAMSGSGALTKTGVGSLRLSGLNSYTGGTVVAAGLLMGTTTSLQGDITNNAAVVFDQISDGTYAGTMSGSGRLVRIGGGTLTLTGTNSYSGGTVFGGGTISVAADAALGAATGVLVFESGTLQTTATFTMVRATTLNAEGGTFDVATGTTLTQTGDITGIGGLIKQGGGTLVLGGTNSYSDGTTVSAGTLQGTTASLQGNITNNAAVVFDQAFDGTYAGVMSGSGSLTKAGSGALTLSGVSTYTGGTVLNAGILRLGAGAALSSAGALTVNGGTFDLNGNAQTVTALSGSGGTIDLGIGTLTVVQNQETVYRGAIVGTGALAVQGSIGAKLTLTGANTYSGGTTLTDVSLFGTTDSLQGSILATNSFVAFDQATSGTYAGVISGNGHLSKSGEGTVVLTGANTYTGNTAVNDGILRLGVGGSLSASTSLFMGGGTFDLNGVSQTVGELRGATGTITLGNGTLTVNQISDSIVSVRISGAGGFVKTGSGRLALIGSSDYTGGTTVSGGTLLGTTNSLQGNIVNDATVVFEQSVDDTYAGDMSGSGRLIKTGTGNLTLSGVNTYSNGTTVSAGSLTGTTTSLQGDIANDAIVAFDQATDGTYAGAMDGGGRLIKIGTGNLTLSGANTYSGGTTVSGGTLTGTSTSLQGDITNNAVVVFDQVFGGTYAGAMSGTGHLVKGGSGNLTLSGANTYSGGTTVLDGSLTGTTSSLQGNIANGSAVFFDQATAGTYAGILSGAGNLVIANGDVTLTGANSYSGTTTVQGGATLRLGTGGSLGSTRLLDVNATGTFDLGGRTQTVGGLTGAGTVQLDAGGVLTVDQAINQTFSGVISGDGSLIKAGSSNLTLTGANSYTGGTTVSAGTLTGTTTSLRGAITNNAAVVFEQSSDGTYAGVMSGSGTLTKTGSGNLTLTGANSYGGGTTVSGGTLTGTTTSLQGTITVVSGANLTFDQSTIGTYAGSLNGGGALTVSGGGAVMLTGTASHSGGTMIAAGAILQIGNGGTTGWLAGNVVTNGTLSFYRSDDIVFAGDISGSGGVTLMGTAKVTLTGNNTYSGATTVGGGVIVASSDAQLGPSGNALILNGGAVQTTASFATARPIELGANGGTFDTNGNTLTLSGTLSGDGRLTKAGAGTLILFGISSYIGGTTVSGGTLQGTTDTLLGDITNNATVAFIQTTAGTYGGVLSGTGAVAIDGNITFTGTNTYSGLTTISMGSSLTFGGTGSIQGNVANSGTLQFAGTGTSTFGGEISGSGAVEQVSGTTVLTGTSSYTGGTTISGGTLRLGVGGKLALTGAVTVTGGTFDLDGNAQTIGALSGTSGTVALGNGGVLTVDQSSNTSFAGVIAGDGSLIKAGSGTLVLDGANTYTGGTIVNAGILRMGAGGQMPPFQALTVNGGTFDLNGANQIVGTLSGIGGTIDLGAGTLTAIQRQDATYGGVITGTGGLVVMSNGGGQLTLTGANTYSGGTTVDHMWLIGTTDSLQGNIVANGATIIFDQGMSGSYAGVMSGSGALVKKGSGAVT